MVSDDILEIKDVFLKTGNWIIGNIFKKNFNNKEVTPQIKISTTTWGLYYILEKYNYLEKSTQSPDSLLNNLPINLKKYWFRGYLDGDGCVRFKNKKYMSLVFASSYNQNWNFLMKICEEMKIRYLIRQYSNKLGGYSQFTIYRKYDVLNFCEFIYDDFDNIGLKRKHNKFLEIERYIKNKDLNGWTNIKNKWLLDNYDVLGGKKCSEYLGKSLTSIYNKIRHLKEIRKE
jgi:predicted DNA-binding transcriptional regulator AlpA